MKKLDLAVISDIHVGEGARAKDLCLAPAANTSKRKSAKLDDRYTAKFLDFVTKN